MWAVVLTLRDATTRKYAEDDLTFNGNSYLGLLAEVSGFEMRRSMTVGSGSFSLSNIDLRITKETAAQPFDGATVVVSELLLGLGTQIDVATGIVTDEEEGENVVTFQVVDRLDPVAAPVPARIFSNLCTHIYKDDECGSVSGLTTCAKTFAECTARAATERFNGFPTVNRKGLNIIQSIDRPTADDGGFGSAGNDDPISINPGSVD